MSDDFQQRGGSPWGTPPGGGSGNGSGKLVRTVHEDIMRLDGFYTTAGCNDLPDRCIT